MSSPKVGDKVVAEARIGDTYVGTLSKKDVEGSGLPPREEDDDISHLDPGFKKIGAARLARAINARKMIQAIEGARKAREEAEKNKLAKKEETSAAGATLSPKAKKAGETLADMLRERKEKDKEEAEKAKAEEIRKELEEIHAKPTSGIVYEPKTDKMRKQLAEANTSDERKKIIEANMMGGGGPVADARVERVKQAKERLRKMQEEEDKRKKLEKFASSQPPPERQKTKLRTVEEAAPESIKRDLIIEEGSTTTKRHLLGTNMYTIKNDLNWEFTIDPNMTHAQMVRFLQRYPQFENSASRIGGYEEAITEARYGKELAKVK